MSSLKETLETAENMRRAATILEVNKLHELRGEASAGLVDFYDWTLYDKGDAGTFYDFFKRIKRRSRRSPDGYLICHEIASLERHRDFNYDQFLTRWEMTQDAWCDNIEVAICESKTHLNIYLRIPGLYKGTEASPIFDEDTDEDNDHTSAA